MHTDVGIFYKTRDINIAVIVSFRSKFCDKKKLENRVICENLFTMSDLYTLTVYLFMQIVRESNTTFYKVHRKLFLETF